MSNERSEAVSPRRINALKKLATSNFARFAVQVQHMSADVQAKLIEQLPEFRRLATDAIDKIDRAHERTLKSIEMGQTGAQKGIVEWRSALIKMLDDPNLTLDDKLRVTTQIGETVQANIALLKEVNRTKAAMFVQAALGVTGVVALIIVALAGGKAMIDQGDSSA